MKTRLQITLEDEASNILSQQENKSQYIEELILKSTNADLAQEIKRLAMLVDGQLNDIRDIQQNIATIKQKIDGLSSNGRTADFDSANLGSSPSEPARTKAEILAEISSTEAEYAYKAVFCQDPDTLKQMKKECNDIVSALWREYRELDAKTESI